MRYIPNTDEDRREMLQTIGLAGVEELFSDVPLQVKLEAPLKLPSALSEQELVEHARRLSAENVNIDDYVCFRGAGAYDHFIPSVVRHILSRAEFYTSYTPYQPEISQGTLQAIYEYQSLICQLTEMEVSNASMYDGASALAEAVLMSHRVTGRDKVFLSRALHPEYRQVVRTYLQGMPVKAAEIPCASGLTDIDWLKRKLDDQVASVVVQHPNFFGLLEEADEISQIAHQVGALFVVSVDPISLGILQPPGAYGADIAVGEGQALGGEICFGGPYLGFFATREQFLRNMPGRLVGATVDSEGRRGFVLTLQTREQHIRRAKATSNICSNESLNALAATVYLTTLGKEGLREVALLCLRKAHYAWREVSKLSGFSSLFPGAFFKEFTVSCPSSPERINQSLLKRKIIGGLELKRFYPEYPNGLLVCVTEKRTKEQIDGFVKALKETGEQQ